MRKRLLIFFILGTWSLCTLPAFGQSIDDIILDIYRAATEFTELDYEQLQADLYALHDAPIDLNHTSDEELSQLRFLSPRQIDDILLYADKHPFVSLYELRLIPSLEDYDAVYRAVGHFIGRWGRIDYVESQNEGSDMDILSLFDTTRLHDFRRSKHEEDI